MNIFEQILKDQKLSRAELAKSLSIAESYLSMLINGKRKMSKTIALRIKKKYKLSLDEIFFADTVHRKRVGHPKTKAV